MSSTLYISNFPPDLTEEQLQTVLTEFAPVVSITPIEQAANSTLPPAVRVEIEQTDLAEILKKLNGHQLGTHRLAATSHELPPKTKASPEINERVKAIAKRLGETENYALRQIKEIVQLCGLDFTQAILEETEEIEKTGGMKTVNGTRKRTFGGIFFYLARGRMAPALRKVIFYSKPRNKPKKSAKNTQPASPRATTELKHSDKPEISDNRIENPQARLSDLRQALHKAEEHLEFVKAAGSEQQGGTFSAIKAILDIKKQINDLLKQHPELA